MTNDAARRIAGFAAFGLLAAGISTAALVVGGSPPAAAADLVRFSSCDELQAWTADVAETAFGVPGDAVISPAEADASVGGAGSAAGAPAPAAGRAESGGDDAATGDGGATTGAGADLAETGGTNTVVEGVDEIDVVDRLPGDRGLVSRNGTVALVDLTGPAVLSHVGGLPFDARISVAGDLVWVAGTATDGTGVQVVRLRLDGDALVADGQWSSPGFLVDARRTGDTLYVVAVDQPAGGAIPFDGGPVPCGDVWRPEVPADTPAATLLVALPADGELAPTGAAEVVGSGSGFLVTGDAAYVTTQTWGVDGVEVSTGIHRFDLATLAPTGSGQVPGVVPGPFGLNEHDGHLRVATSAGGFGGGVVGMPMPVEGDGGIGGGRAVDVAVDAAGAAETAAQAPETALAEVFVLDLAGPLDVVGRTGRFGHDFETIHGVRFVGDTAYVVTFRQTDPFWVIDLANPTAPAVVGELQIPGFSAYLHPVDADHVVGFGPDGNGQLSARLFRVSDPQAPSVVDEVVIGDDSPVAWDHHAFVALGESTFAVPATRWPRVVDERCAPAPEPQPLPEPQPVPPPDQPDPRPIEPGIGDGTGGAPPFCEPVFAGGSTGAVVLEARGGELDVVDEAMVDTDGSVTAERVLPLEAGGWVLLGWDRLVAVGGDTVLLPSA